MCLDSTSVDPNDDDDKKNIIHENNLYYLGAYCSSHRDSDRLFIHAVFHSVLFILCMSVSVCVCASVKITGQSAGVILPLNHVGSGE